uniref:Uncharacterized protein n=1 Tax=Oryza glumipatula TaxID=40148 RepID=A0A0D9ZI41_9ORYZ
MEVEGIVKLRPLYASRRGVPGAALRLWVWVLLGFTTNGLTSGPGEEGEEGRRLFDGWKTATPAAGGVPGCDAPREGTSRTGE